MKRAHLIPRTCGTKRLRGWNRLPAPGAPCVRNGASRFHRAARFVTFVRDRQGVSRSWIANRPPRSIAATARNRRNGAGFSPSRCVWIFGLSHCPRQAWLSHPTQRAAPALTGRPGIPSTCPRDALQYPNAYPCRAGLSACKLTEHFMQFACAPIHLIFIEN